MTIFSLAAVLAAVASDFELRTTSLDEQRPDEVLVRIRAVGLCHTDLSVQIGTTPDPLEAVLPSLRHLARAQPGLRHSRRRLCGD
jgi:aryl-alcohol dehydrogenase